MVRRRLARWEALGDGFGGWGGLVVCSGRGRSRRLIGGARRGRLWLRREVMAIRGMRVAMDGGGCVCGGLVSFVQMSGRSLDKRIQTGPEISSCFLSTNPTGWKGHLIALLYREQHKTRASEAAAEANTALGAVGHLLAVIQSLPTTQRPRCSPPDEHDRKPYQSKIQLGQPMVAVDSKKLLRQGPAKAARRERSDSKTPPVIGQPTASQARLEPLSSRSFSPDFQRLRRRLGSETSPVLAVQLLHSTVHTSHQSQRERKNTRVPIHFQLPYFAVRFCNKKKQQKRKPSPSTDCPTTLRSYRPPVLEAHHTHLHTHTHHPHTGHPPPWPREHVRTDTSRRHLDRPVP